MHLEIILNQLPTELELELGLSMAKVCIILRVLIAVTNQMVGGTPPSVTVLGTISVL